MSITQEESLTVAFEKCVSIASEIDTSRILYISLTLNNEDINEILKIFNITSFIINEKFHITLLYTGGKHNKKIDLLKPFFDKLCQITIDKIAISNKFITLCVCKISHEDNDIPYFGNEFKHITIGKKDKKLAPKDSPSAFSEGIVMSFDKHYTINGIIEPELKK